jgi:hypothetical protein
MRSDAASSPAAAAAPTQQHTFSFVAIEHVIMKRLQNVPDREFVQISCVLSVAPAPPSSDAVRKLRVVMETSRPRTAPPQPVPDLVWKICENKFIDQ